jgi:lysophospholipase L1-like esterase
MNAHRSIALRMLGGIASVLFLLALTGHAQTSAPSAASGPANILVKNGQTVVFMGDSITGMGWSETGGYIHLVASGLDTLGVKITPIPAGVGGNKSDDMLARLTTDALSKKPDWLLLSCGVNDVWSRKIDLETFKKNITSIVDQAQAAGIKVMLLTPTPIYEMAKTEFSKLSDYAAFMVQLGKDRKLPVADENAAEFSYFATQPPDPINNILTIDGVHPNPDGHQIMAQTVLQAFGVTPEQMIKVRTKWIAAPDGANLPIGFGVRGKLTITADQNAALEKVAADRKVPMENLVKGLFMEAIRDAMVAHDNLLGVSEETISQDALPIFKQKVEKLAPVPSPPRPPAATDVTLVPDFGFRDDDAIHISIPQYETFKRIALEKKLTKHQLTIGLFMEAIRDTLIAHGDISNINQDNISHDSWPLYVKNVAEVVK